MHIKIIRADKCAHIEAIRGLFREYEEFLGIDLCFQAFEQELAGLPGRYAPPEGALFLALDGERAAGCVALRKLADGVCEMKRLYVREQYRGRGLGKALAKKVVAEGCHLGYGLMRLDTLERLAEAIRLYESLGFATTAPYYDNPLDGVRYMELKLTGG